jgi:tetratricopeptide (TPR) repeat protein
MQNRNLSRKEVFDIACPLLKKGQYDIAYTMFEQQDKIDKSIYADTKINMARCLNGLGKCDEALKLLAGIKGVNEKTKADFRITYASCLQNKFLQTQNSDFLLQSKQHLDQIPKEDRDRIKVKLAFATWHSRNNDPAAAMEFLDEVFAEDPENKDASVILSQLGRPADEILIKMLAQAETAQGQKKLTLLSTVTYHNALLPGAVEKFAQAILESKTQDLRMILHLAHGYEHQGNREKAGSIYKDLTETNPQFWSAKIAYANMLLHEDKQHKPEESECKLSIDIVKPILDAAHSKSSPSPVILSKACYVLQKAYTGLRESQLANDYIELGLRYNPKNAPLRSARTKNRHHASKSGIVRADQKTAEFEKARHADPDRWMDLHGRYAHVPKPILPKEVQKVESKFSEQPMKAARGKKIAKPEPSLSLQSDEFNLLRQRNAKAKKKKKVSESKSSEQTKKVASKEPKKPVVIQELVQQPVVVAQPMPDKTANQPTSFCRKFGMFAMVTTMAAGTALLTYQNLFGRKN